MKRAIVFVLVISSFLLLCACQSPSPDDPTGTTSAETTPAETSVPSLDIENHIQEFFEWEPPVNYIVIDNYDDLQRVYSQASVEDGGGKYFYIEGNWKKSQEENTYDEEFFKTGFIVVAMFHESCMGMGESFEYAINRIYEDYVHIGIHSVEPNPASAHGGGYLLIIPVESQYKGQEVIISYTRTSKPLSGS